tara:strand:- start:134 stop:361 length:228 start_codon:yes stop_codon:yes gene_type:complete
MNYLSKTKRPKWIIFISQVASMAFTVALLFTAIPIVFFLILIFSIISLVIMSYNPIEDEESKSKEKYKSEKVIDV